MTPAAPVPPPAVYNNTAATAPAARPVGLARRMAGRWDMTGVLALLGSSAAYGVFALAHLGL